MNHSQKVSSNFLLTETNAYVNFTGATLQAGTVAGINNYIRPSDLNGRYYDQANYFVAGTVIIATGGRESAPGVTMDLINGATNDLELSGP